MTPTPTLPRTASEWAERNGKRPGRRRGWYVWRDGRHADGPTRLPGYLHRTMRRHFGAATFISENAIYLALEHALRAAKEI